MSQPAQHEARFAGFVLAGGRSSRMGADKALVELAGRPLIAYALDALRGVGLTPSIAGATSDLSAFAPVVPDAEPGRGPLGGLWAALERSASPCAVFVSVDMPLLPPSLLAYLMRHAETTQSAVTVASVNDFAQTFPAVIQRHALPFLRAELETGSGGCFSAFAQAGLSVVPVEMLVQAGHVRHPRGLPACQWFRNVNTRDELQRLERELLLPHAPRGSMPGSGNPR